MTEAELLEVVIMYGEAALGTFAVYISILFAYLTVAYFIGANLSKFQTASVTALFLIASTMLTLTCMNCVHVWEKLIPEQPSVLTSLPFFTLGIWHTYMAVSMTMGILICLYFMHDVRKTARLTGSA